MIFFVFRVNRYISMMKALWPLLWKDQAGEQERGNRHWWK